MVTDEKLKREAYASVSKFCKEFNLNYGVYPTVLYTLSKDKIKTISLKNIEELINNILKRTYDDSYNIRSKTRLKHIIIYRHVMFKILYDMGYTYTLLANYFNYSHATIEVYNILKNEIAKENEPNAVVQYDIRGEIDT